MRAATGPDLGGYRLLLTLATGGMATAHLARHRGARGFERLVVIKQIHPHLTTLREFADMFLDEAHLASQIRHPNVVPVDDVVDAEGELFLVQPYVESVSLATLLKAAAAAGERLAPAVTARILADALAGLDGAHHARGLRGEPLEIVHRDVSPHNLLVGSDGRSRLIDFGIAKAARRITVTRSGALKGKIHYMAPEQLRRRPVDARADVFAAGVVLYEALTGARPFDGDDEADTLLSILMGEPSPPSTRVPGLPATLDAVVARALDGERDARWSSAAELLDALERALPPAPAREVAAVVERLCGPQLADLRTRVGACLDAGAANPPEAGVLATSEGPAPSEGPASTEGPAPSAAPEARGKASGPVRVPSRRSLRIAALLGLAGAAVAAMLLLGARGEPRDGLDEATTAGKPSSLPSTGVAAEVVAPEVAASPPGPSAAVAPAVTARRAAGPPATAPGAASRSAPAARPVPAAGSSDLHPNPYEKPAR